MSRDVQPGAISRASKSLPIVVQPAPAPVQGQSGVTLPADFADCTPYTAAGELTQLSVLYEPARRTLWMRMRPQPQPCFTTELLREILRVFDAVRLDDSVDFCVFGSALAGIFNTGGDLALFASAIRRDEQDELRKYAYLCCEAVYEAYRGLGRDIIGIALVEGSALGGGFEAALAHQYVFAQKDAKLGFPEIAFNLFPGMGAYSFVSRRTNRRLCQQLITSGTAHTAEWCAEQGLVDTVFDPGQGVAVVRAHIDSLRPRLNGVKAMFRAARRVDGLTHDELLDITDDWVDAAFRLSEPELAYMEKLVKLQRKRVGTSAATVPARTASCAHGHARPQAASRCS